jgi:Flp pilus assembly pilin Flp
VGKFRLLLESEAGQDVVEYALLIAVIALVVLLTLNAFGHVVEPWFAALAAHITTTGT